MEENRWRTVARPGWFGEKRDLIKQNYDRQYGEGNWRIRHQLGARTLAHEEALLLYELSYELHFLNPATRYLWLNLIKEAKDVWTEEVSDIESGLDYLRQKARANHYEDMAVRRILSKHRLNFQGGRLIRIRADSEDIVGVALSSIHIPFLFPDNIEPSITDILWWNRHQGSLEKFWHDNKILQIKSV